MEKTKFIWLLDSGSSRRGRRLEHGWEHDIAAFGTDIVAEWVRSGAAVYVDSESVEKSIDADVRPAPVKKTKRGE